MNVKIFEIRDAATFMPVMAIELGSQKSRELYLLSRAGYSKQQTDLNLRIPLENEPYIILCKLDGVEAQYDPFAWPNRRTLYTAHQHMITNWDNLVTGDVIDVEYILGETTEPKESEQVTHPL